MTDITCPTCGTTVGHSPVVQVGDTLHGFCAGLLGRDAYECKQVVAVGSDWVVCRVVNDYRPDTPALFATGYRIRRDLAAHREPERMGDDACCTPE